MFAMLGRSGGTSGSGSTDTETDEKKKFYVQSLVSYR